MNTATLFALTGALLMFLSTSAANAMEEDIDVDEDTEIDVESLYTEKLTWAADLVEESRQAACNGQPLVVMFGSSSCPYCSVVRSLYLAPLEEDPRYPGILVRELGTDSPAEVRDFSGNKTTMNQIASSYGIFLVPTVVVFGPDGKQVGKPLVGLSTEDFYGFYLDEAILAGIAAVKQRSSGEPSAVPGVYACD